MNFEKLRKELDIKHTTIRAILRIRPGGATARQTNGSYS